MRTLFRDRTYSCCVLLRLADVSIAVVMKVVYLCRGI